MNYFILRGEQQCGPYTPGDRLRYVASGRWKFHLAVLTGMLSAACLYWLPPWRYGFYPRCPIFVFTHLQCPGCGMTRALAALLHGQIALSWHYNPLALLLLPWLGVYLAMGYWQRIRHGQWQAPRLPWPVLVGILVAITVFGIGRNLHVGLR
jgi:hypothetical protein